MRSRFSSGSPYTASDNSAGCVCSVLYHVRYAAASANRKSAPKSTTRTPRAKSSAASSMDAPWGTARNATSQRRAMASTSTRSEEHTSELQSRENLVCRLLLEKKKKKKLNNTPLNK